VAGSLVVQVTTALAVVTPATTIPVMAGPTVSARVRKVPVSETARLPAPSALTTRKRYVVAGERPASEIEWARVSPVAGGDAWGQQVGPNST
jgi:hypothetical protein